MDHLLERKRRWLLAKGYESVRHAKRDLVEALWGMYHKSEKQTRAAPKEWKSWGQTFRLHHRR